MIALRLFEVARFGPGVDQEFENSGMVANSQLQNYGFGTSGVVASAAAGSAGGAGASGAIAVSQSALMGFRSAVVSEPSRSSFESADSATILIVP